MNEIDLPCTQSDGHAGRRERVVVEEEALDDGDAGAEVTGYSLDPPTNPSLYDVVRGEAFNKDLRGDVRDRDALERAIAEARPEVLFHLAAQPLVRRSYAEPLETLEVNALGTANVL